MKTFDLRHELERFAGRGGDMAEQYELVKQVEASRLGVDSVNIILRFFEENEELDTGAPGPLVHYVETFYKAGYEERLIDSLERKPTLKTLEMLNRLINGTDDSKLRKRYSEVCEEASRSASASFEAKEEAFRLLARYNE